MGDRTPYFSSIAEKEIDLSLLNSLTKRGRYTHGAYVPFILFVRCFPVWLVCVRMQGKSFVKVHCAFG
jgi:hypothetical protein